MTTARLPRGCSLVHRADRGGRWVLNYTGPAGAAQRSVPRDVAHLAAHRARAEAWSVAWLSAASIDPPAALAALRATGPTVAACAPRWLALRAVDPRVAPSTLGGNRGHLGAEATATTPARGYILPRFGGTALAALDVPALREWLRDLRARLSPSTTRNVFYSFATFFSDAMAEGWVRRETSPFAHPGVVKELPALEQPEPVALPLATGQALLDAPTTPLDRAARYAVALLSGLRDGELAGLRLSDVDRAAPVPWLRVRVAVALHGGAGWATEGPTKTRGSRRALPLHPAAVAALDAWLGHGWPTLVGRLPRPDDLLFPSASGGPSRPRSAELLRADLEAAGLPVEVDGRPVEMKSTRSSFASWLEAEGVSLEVRQRLLGHAGRTVTERHYTARELAPLAAAVALVRLVWTRGTMPGLVPGGMFVEPIRLVLEAPPARIGRATFGLGNGRRLNAGGAADRFDAGGSGSEQAYRIGVDESIGVPRGCQTGPAGGADMPPELAGLGRGLGLLLAGDDALERWAFEAGADEAAERGRGSR